MSILTMNSSEFRSANVSEEASESSGEEDYDEEYDAASLYVIVSNLVIMAVSIPSNLVVLYSISRISKPKQSFFTFISKHLCLASLYIACVTLPINTGWHITFKWHADTLGCKLFMALRVIGFYMAAFLITTLSINRYLIVKHQRSVHADRRTSVCVYLLWLMSALASVPQVFAFGLHEYDEPQFTQCAPLNDQPDPHFGTRFNYQAYSVAHFLLCYVLPVTVLCAVQVAFLTVLKQPAAWADSGRCESPECEMLSQQLPSNQSVSVRFTVQSCRLQVQGSRAEPARESGRALIFVQPASNDVWLSRPRIAKSDTKLLGRARKLTLRTSATMLAFYVACWTPHYVMVFITWFYPELENRTPALLKQILTSCAMINCSANPLVYGFMVPTIRNISKGIFSQLFTKIASVGRNLLHLLRRLLCLRSSVNYSSEPEMDY